MDVTVFDGTRTLSAEHASKPSYGRLSRSNRWYESAREALRNTHSDREYQMATEEVDEGDRSVILFWNFVDDDGETLRGQIRGLKHVPNGGEQMMNSLAELVQETLRLENSVEQERAAKIAAEESWKQAKNELQQMATERWEREDEQLRRFARAINDLEARYSAGSDALVDADIDTPSPGDPDEEQQFPSQLGSSNPPMEEHDRNLEKQDPDAATDDNASRSDEENKAEEQRRAYEIDSLLSQDWTAD